MAITRGHLNGNRDNMVAFINLYTATTGISAELKNEGGNENILISGKLDTDPPTLTRIFQINNTQAGNNTYGSHIGYSGTVNFGTRQLPQIGYATTNGLLFIVSPSGGQAQGFILSKTNNGKYGSSLQDSNGYPYASGYALALDEIYMGTLSGITMWREHLGQSSWTNDSYRKDQMQLVPIPTNGNGGISYFPHAFWIPHSPTRAYGVVQIGEKKYAMSSYMALEE